MSWQTLKAFHEYFEQRPHMLQFYKMDHMPFNKWDDEPSVNIVCAYWVYKRALKNLSGKIVLGGGSLRNDMQQIRQFGLLTGQVIQDDEVAKWAKVQLAIDKFRGYRQKAQNAQPLQQTVPFKPPIVVGYGSILSDKAWTPLVNDSLLLGAIHGRRQFYLDKPAMPMAPVLPANRQPAPSAAKFAELRAGFGLRGPQKSWADYLKGDREILWNAAESIPRVLCRELLGLQVFGYMPRFEEDRLTFIPGSASADSDFTKYRTALVCAGMFETDPKAPRAAIAKYLFGDPAALN